MDAKLQKTKYPYIIGLYRFHLATVLWVLIVLLPRIIIDIGLKMRSLKYFATKYPENWRGNGNNNF